RRSTMSLAFLAKKSWHTSNLRNVEKVWLAEQKHAAEEKKLAELKKNIDEERQLQELRQLQAAQGKKSATLERLDWMYEGPMAHNTNSAEEYLLGKEYKPDEAESDLKKLGESKYGSLALTKAALPANDAFSRLNEDPLMMIRKQQQLAQENVLKNPVKMGKIKANVDKILKDKKQSKKAKKEAKRERKHKKHKRSVSTDSEREGERRHHDDDHKGDRRGGQDRRDDERSRRRNRSRSRSPTVHRSRHYSRDRSPERNRASPRREGRSGRREDSPRDWSPRRRDDSRVRDRRDRSHHRSPSPRRGSRDRSSPRRRDVRDRKREESPRQLRSRRRSPRERRSTSPRAERRPRSRSRDRDDRTRGIEGKKRELQRDEFGRDTPPRRRKSSTDEGERSAAAARRRFDATLNKKGQYGLINDSDAVRCKDIDKSTLGPNSKYIEKAREARRKEEEERLRKLGKGDAGKPVYSEEEKRRLAQQMIEDARQREEYLAKRAVQKKVDNEPDSSAPSDGDPQFLREMQEAAYIGKEGNIEDRLKRNAHYIQKKADKGSFLSK
ncbi:TPA: hypothetical protein N0F65_001986, partial [Lagenidium giganteum]